MSKIRFKALLNMEIPEWIISLLRKLPNLMHSTFTLERIKLGRGSPRGVMVKALDCGIIVSEFVLQSRYYVHFRANTLGKGKNPLILPAMG